MRIVVTGGAGFIGSALVRHLIGHTDHEVLVLDKLTYAGSLTSLSSVQNHSRYQFDHSDICDRDATSRVFAAFDPDAVMHLAAESHVDRSIDGPADFVNTNVVGTYILLEESLKQWRRRDNFRFLHVSTDEVFGSLASDEVSTEDSRYNPRSPYSATKAASDHLVRAWFHTYGLPILVTNCCNNYGPYQFPEKLIPLIITKGLAGAPMPIYGQGLNVRDWLYVDDHAVALVLILERGRIGQTYNVGGDAQRRNIDVAHSVCAVMDKMTKCPTRSSHRDLITYVPDRPGHDFRYAIDASKLCAELGWSAKHSFENGIEATVGWYLANRAWWEPLLKKHHVGPRRGLPQKTA